MAEMDLLAALASGHFTVAKDLGFQVGLGSTRMGSPSTCCFSFLCSQVQTLNVVRKTLEQRHVSLAFFDRLRAEGLAGARFFIAALDKVSLSPSFFRKKNGPNLT